MKLAQWITRRNPDNLDLPEDFARFYESNHRNVFRYLMVLCGGNQDEAEEITAEAFLRAWEKRQQFTGSSSAALGWVITIARNILIDHRRAEGAHPVEEILEDTLIDDRQLVEDILIGEEQLGQVLSVMSSLPFLQQNILNLRFVLGWRVKAIADHLGLPENTVSVNLRRSLSRLQKLIEDQIIRPGSE